MGEYKYYKSKDKEVWEEITINEVREYFADGADYILKKMETEDLIANIRDSSYYYKADTIDKAPLETEGEKLCLAK